jgi:phosphoglycerol transferase MdoB-like AlkP superfamily enzyme
MNLVIEDLIFLYGGIMFTVLFNIIRLLLFFFLSIVNPINMVFAYFITWYCGLFPSVGFLEAHLSLILFPVYAAICFFLSLIALLILYYMFDVGNSKPLSTVIDKWNYSQIIYIIFTPALKFVFTGTELNPNLVGFIIAPIFILVSIITILISIFWFFRLLKGDSLKENKVAAGLEKGVFILSISLLTWCFFALWHQGPYTKLASLYVREDTPYYAVHHALAALQNNDATEFTRFVDLEKIIAKSKTKETELLESKILEEIRSGSSRISTNKEKPTIILQEWALQRIGRQSNFINVDDFAELIVGNNNVYCRLHIVSLKTGERHTLDLNMEKQSGIYRITGIISGYDSLLQQSEKHLYAKQIFYKPKVQ